MKKDTILEVVKKLHRIEDRVAEDGIGSDFAYNARARHARLTEEYLKLTGERWGEGRKKYYKE